MQRTFELELETFTGVKQYCIYRSVELNNYNFNPIIGGVYVWRPELGDTPPNKMTITLEWGDEEQESPAPEL